MQSVISFTSINELVYSDNINSIDINVNDKCFISIIKAEDNYFYVMNNINSYYKCDEIDGVIDLLKTILSKL